MVTPNPTPLVMQRYECKYLVPESEARRVYEHLAPFLRPDAHAARNPNNTYAICSLYLDGADLALCRETVEGKANRFKLRVRSYSDEPQKKLFLEVKRRISGVVRKTRCTLPRELLPAVLAGRCVEFASADPLQLNGLAEFTRLLLATSAQPRVLVRYDREAYVGAVDDSVRVTFDRRLRAKRTDRTEVIVNAPAFQNLNVRGVIMELKFNDRCPAWLLHVVKRHNLRRRSFSKYCTSLESTGSRDLRVVL
jgi:hypothetical protein